MHKLKLYGFFVGFMTTILLICDALAFKVVSIYGCDFAASGLIFPLGFLLASIITEVYGYSLAGRIIWVQLMCQMLFILMISIFVYLPSPESSPIASLYFELYQNLWHVLLAASVAVVAAYFINDIIMSQLKIYLFGKYFIIRFFISNAIGNAILVSISYPINFYGLYSLNHIVIIAFNTWLYKVMFSILLFPLAILISNVIKKIEKLDNFDYGISYNPLVVFNENNSGRNIYEKTNNIKKWHHQGYSID